jgi:hypothetical protein
MNELNWVCQPVISEKKYRCEGDGPTELGM